MNRKPIRPNLTEIKERMSQDKDRDKEAARKRMHPPTDTFAGSYYYLKQMNKKTLMAVVSRTARGIWLVVSRQVPALQQWLDVEFSWPIWTIGAGILIFIIGLIVGAPGMAVPASIVTGIGCIMYYQNATGDFASWSYMWTLIPGFVGVGLILAGLLGENTRKNISSGLNLIVISVVLFLIFGTLLGGLAILGPYGPAILLIALGVYILVRGFLRPKGGQNETR